MAPAYHITLSCHHLQLKSGPHFNLAIMKLPAQLAKVEGVQHALYADDITISAKHGSVGDIEANLQQAAEIVDAYALRCGLQCSPFKSEFDHVDYANPPHVLWGCYLPPPHLLSSRKLYPNPTPPILITPPPSD
ncbi:hypothetical protein HPB49_013382 [Dermacentor silvarum]|uniref:Uncharacterized protein n=1 Tax=Dermacentor silvarum TaxID=543639 RepID=A0ACB8CFE8_DERSI|nr:hypothetical protein HPB49_013382 [Dermacentor silvarum]